jgi:hypothetical protein
MEFPDDVLKIIRDYSMPVTRPDWRNLHKMTYIEYETAFFLVYKKRYEQNRYDKLLFSVSNYCNLFAYN